MPRRRGVLLLVVLSVLVLFLMIGTAFIITAKQAEKAAKNITATAIQDTAANARGAMLTNVMLQILRDTDDPLSSLRGHSLLGDLYGNDGFRARIVNVRWAAPLGAAAGADNPSGGQMIQFELDTTADFNSALAGNQFVVDPYNQPFALSPLDDAYASQVLTFTTAGAGASAKNVSTRIISYTWLPGYTSPTFTAMAFNLANGTPIYDPSFPASGPARLNNSRILVNGRPFNGTGAGLDPTHVAGFEGPRLDAKEYIPGVADPYEVALMPNPIFFNPRNDATTIALFNSTTTGTGLPYFMDQLGLTDVAGRGGADESYDAPDFQNMLLAFVQDQTEDSQPPTGFTIENMVLPSLHRPDLIWYWDFRLLAAGAQRLATNARMLRKVSLRPNHLDHPNFTGSNTQYAEALIAFQDNPTDEGVQARMLHAYTFGPWDVDNDNDGARDSVWVDVGLPVQMGPNGKLVKPLAAILCVDLDGRINVNTAGSLDLAGVANNLEDVLLSIEDDGDRNETDDTPKGIGWGVAEISAKAALGEMSFAQLMLGRQVGADTDTTAVVGSRAGMPRNMPGRYGYDRDPGRGLWYDTMAQITLYALPQYGNQRQRTVFALPPDLRARYGNAVNSFGQLVAEGTLPSEWDVDMVAGRPMDGRLDGDNPYEALMFAEGSDAEKGGRAYDAPYSIAELERILRPYDTDATTLPDRLASVTGVFSPLGDADPTSSLQRNRITVESWSIPAPTVTMPHEMDALRVTDPATLEADPTLNRLPRSTAELFEMRIRQALFPGDATKRFPIPLDGVPGDPTTPLGKVRVIMRQILAPELAAGRKLDVNRPLGNGRDDNDNGVVDEPGEDLATVGNQRWMWKERPSVRTDIADRREPLDPNYANALFAPVDVDGYVDADGDGTRNEILTDDRDALRQRQLLARHLYTLALTLTVPADYGGGVGATDKARGEQAMCRRLAQWAINVVDYRDADNIMTTFEYDLNPFDGWNVDGDLTEPTKQIDDNLGTAADHEGPDGTPGNSDDTYVIGAERPEMLITETLAWHDRQSYDSGNEDYYPPSDPAGIGLTDPESENFDPDYDQGTRPRGALFIELYNPWNPAPGASADTHAVRPWYTPPSPAPLAAGQAADLGVDLRKFVDHPTRKSPVWRMLIYKRGQAPLAQQGIDRAALWDPDARPGESIDGMQRPPMPVDRSVYFTPFDPEQFADATHPWDDDGVAFFADPTRENNVSPLRPGRYMVVGSGEIYANDGVYESGIGDPVPVGDVPPDLKRPRPRRRIELDTNPFKTNRVRMIDQGDTVILDPVSGYRVESPAEVIMDGRPAKLAGDNSTCIADVAIIDHVWDRTDNYDDVPGSAPGSRNLRRRRLTLSEPARGYVHRFMNAQWSDADNRYRNPETPLVPLDIPLDGPIAVGGKTSRQVLDERTNDEGEPLFNDTYPIPAYLNNIDPALTTVGELKPTNDPRVSYAFIYLQRLANPLLPWNPPPAPGTDPRANGHDPELEVNPYVTVDDMSSNLTVFNGNARNKTDILAAGYEEDKETSPDGNGTNTNDSRLTFASLERGFLADGNTVAGNPNPPSDEGIRLWNPTLPSQRVIPKEIATRPSRGPRPAVPHNHYAFTPGMRSTTSRQVILDVPFCTLGFLNSPLQDRTGVPAGVDGPIRTQLQPDEDRPLTWNPWNNRPFVSGNELMLVPRVRAAMLLRQHTTNENAEEDDLYDTPVLDKPPQAFSELSTGEPEDITPFTQLENFFFDEEREGGDENSPQPSHLYRLLDYVDTPSMFPGAGEWLNPGWYRNNPGALPTAAAVAIPTMTAGDPRRNLLPPFNWVSKFRDPGKINLNTISSPAVYAGLFHSEEDDADDVSPEGDDEVHPGPEWDDFFQSRRGHPSGDDMLTFDSNVPTFFANPFRSGDAVGYVPLTSMLQRAGGETRGVECTLLRSDDNNPADVDDDPLFAAQKDGDDDEFTFNDPDRTAFFRYAPMTRLNNLVTTQSNVYAVWVTIGFFEVQQVSDLDDVFREAIVSSFDPSADEPDDLDPAVRLLYDRVYPDGYTLGKEDGVDLGTARRLRGFYIIDRSRPVGFDPGLDVNVESTIRLQRRLE